MKTAWMVIGIAAIASVGWGAPTEQPPVSEEGARANQTSLPPTERARERSKQGQIPSEETATVTSATPRKAAEVPPAAPESQTVPRLKEAPPDTRNISAGPTSSAQRGLSVLGRVKEKLSGRKSKVGTPPLGESLNEAADQEIPEESASAVPVALPAVPGAKASATPSLVRSGDYSPLEQTVAKYQPVAESRSVRPADVCSELRSSTARIRTNFTAGDPVAVEREASAIRAQVCGLRSLNSLTLEKRLKVSSICRMLDDGLDMIEQGQRSGDESLVQLGLEKIHQASELLEPLDEEE